MANVRVFGLARDLNLTSQEVIAMSNNGFLNRMRDLGIEPTRQRPNSLTRCERAALFQGYLSLREPCSTSSLLAR